MSVGSSKNTEIYNLVAANTFIPTKIAYSSNSNIVTSYYIHTLGAIKYLEEIWEDIQY